MKRLMRHILRRGETGQTIVIMAFGFIVLLGFVGIVTDVSLLFVRYSTLRRAVDSAAVAAAGQMRRVLPTAEEIAEAGAKGLSPDGLAYARNVATVNLAARQFVELYGLSPSNVLVETCLSSNYTDEELCTDDQRKLVRVTAQVLSPTVFLRLLGWGTVTLEASAVSETAVLDVVLILDVSESMLSQTTHNDWKNVPQRDGSFQDLSARIVPPRMDEALAAAPDQTALWQQVLMMTHDQLLADPRFNQPAQPNANRAFVMSGSTPVAVNLSDPRVPRKVCQARFWPSGVRLIADDLLAEFRAFVGPSYPNRFNHFMLGYNFYGCCNDPNGDGDFF